MHPQAEAAVADVAPTVEAVTPYDEAHFVAYLRVLDAADEGADWRDVAEIVLGRDPSRDRAGAWRCYETHLARAQWFTHTGYRLLLKHGLPTQIQ